MGDPKQNLLGYPMTLLGEAGKRGLPSLGSGPGPFGQGILESQLSGLEGELWAWGKQPLGPLTLWGWVSPQQGLLRQGAQGRGHPCSTLRTAA